jgi:hypothetical protein
VIHSMATPMVTTKGDEMKKDNFTMKVEQITGVGRTTAQDFVAVPAGETPVFFSDAKGSPARFKVYYRLHAYSDVAAGEYSAPIMFSLSEM